MRHIWLRAAGPVTAATRLAAIGELPHPMIVSAHRRLRGPYTAAGTVLREIVPRILETDPDLAQAHDVEILSAAPELGTVLTSRRETQTSTASPKTRTRYYPHAHTTRIGHGLTSLLKAHLAGAAEPATLVVEHVDEADSTDLEWLAAMVRRVSPACLRIVVQTERDDLPEPLGTMLSAYAERVVAEPEPARTTGTPEVLAARYVAGDAGRVSRRALTLTGLSAPGAIGRLGGEGQSAAYAYSSAAAFYIVERFGRRKLLRLYDAFNDPSLDRETGIPLTAQAVRRTLGVSLAELERGLREAGLPG